MIVSESDTSRSRTFTVGDDEWFDRTSFGQKVEDIIAWKLAETFTEEELRKLIKIDIKRIEEKVVEKIAEKVVEKCLKSDVFIEKKK